MARTFGRNHDDIHIVRRNDLSEMNITGNGETYAKMTDNMDIDASGIVAGEKSIADVDREIFQEMITVANGK
jgi:altronate dehydratase